MNQFLLKSFYEARAVLKSHLAETPLLRLHDTKTSQGLPIYLKAECLQPSGSFKIRGATYTLSLLTPEQRSKGVIAYSTGNHAQAVALAARQLGIKATIVMSPEAMPFKVEATRSYGAEIVMTSPQDRKKLTESMALSTGMTLVPPFDRVSVILGQGTIGLEILEHLDPAAVFVCVGGGGLISGIAAAIKQINSQVKIIGVEPELENDAWRSFTSGKLVSMSGPSDSIADAVKIPSLGELTFPLMRTYVDEMITVSEEQIARATFLCMETGHLFVEPAGALALAGALLYEKPLAANKPVVCIASGGNTILPNICQLYARFGMINP